MTFENQLHPIAPLALALAGSQRNLTKLVLERH